MRLLIGCLLFIGVVDVLVSEAGAEDLYVLNDQDQPVKLNTEAVTFNLFGISENELPSRVFFNLFTRATPYNAERLNLNDVNSVSRSHFDPRKPTKFVIHGWQSSTNSKTCTQIRDAFLQNSDCNVILVDWNSISKNEYIWASNQVVKVAKFVAKMIDFLRSRGMNPATTTVVGHSLGAHIAGLSSYYASNKVNYVVALDPAGPNFHNVGPGSRVGKGDGAYVLVIHTSKGLGMSDQLGDADFYPNGGESQVGCGVDLGESCSHGRSHEYFAESINSSRFQARICNNYNDYKSGKCNRNPAAAMGGAAPNFNVRGRYYLATNSRFPFAKN